MPQAQVLGRKLGILAQRYWDGRCDGWPNHADDGRAYLNLACGQVIVANALGPFGDDALDHNGALRADRGRGRNHLGRGPLGVERHLHQPLAIAQVNEDEPAEVARLVHPSAEGDSLARVLDAEGAAQVRAERCGVRVRLWGHGFRQDAWASGRGGSALRGRLQWRRACRRPNRRSSWCDAG